VADDPNDLVQMNVRVPRWLRDRADQRRATMTDAATERPLSRDKWVANAMRYALEAPDRTPTGSTRRRTAPPPR
jgi:TfoX/Sxy family transcriptional regulator of competence genes